MPQKRAAARRAAAALALLGVLALASGAASAGKADGSTVFVIRTDEDAREMVRMHATANNEVLYTTASLTHKGFYAGHMADFAAHLWQSLREIGRMENTIMLSYDLHTCQAIMERGIPCFLDRWSTQPAQLPGPYGKDTPHWYSKYSWAVAMLEWGYTAVFIETDMVFTADPLPHFNGSLYDLQGLSDWRVPEVPDPKTRFKDTCSVYHTVKKPTGEQTLDWGPGDPEDPRHTKHVNPCMSTGYWIAQPTEAAKRFLRDFIQVAVFELTEEVDQIVWNEMIMTYLIGTAKYNPPLRIGLFDDEQFSNFEVYNWRVEQGLPAKPIMLHCGALSGSDKYPMMNKLGFWKAGWWDPSAAQPQMQKLAQRFARGLPRRHRHNLENA